MIKLLPHWVLTDVNPAFYDVESKTAVEQTARVYAKMQELIKEYNEFVNEVNKAIIEFTESTTKDYEEFNSCITKLVHDYITMLDEKIKIQDKKIEDTIIYIKNNLASGITTEVTRMVESGELDVAVLNAIDNIGLRVANLENSSLNQNNEINNLVTMVNNIETISSNQIQQISNLESKSRTQEERIESLENSSIEFEYNEETRELNFIKKDGE